MNCSDIQTDSLKIFVQRPQRKDRTEVMYSRKKGAKAEVVEFLRIIAGPKSAFYQNANSRLSTSDYDTLVSLLEAFRDFVAAGLLEAVSPERRAQLDVVNDFMEQSNELLHAKDVHPAAAAMVIGATLEEFLRTRVDQDALSLGSRKPSIQAYAELLRDQGVLDKQDMKDITAWAGLRNHAAHGEWDQVKDRDRVRLMLEGVNLFLRKHGT
jgi:hypothetical protein